jgi:hypothetical protein
MLIHAEVLMDEIDNVGHRPFSHPNDAESAAGNDADLQLRELFFRARAASKPALPEPTTNTDSIFTRPSSGEGRACQLIKGGNLTPTDRFRSIKGTA